MGEFTNAPKRPRHAKAEAAISAHRSLASQRMLKADFASSFSDGKTWQPRFPLDPKAESQSTPSRELSLQEFSFKSQQPAMRGVSARVSKGYESSLFPSSKTHKRNYFIA